jgi:type II secretory pathway pseudopilin PulG
MCARNKSGGYTIVEVMIFLAVSGFMFFAAAVFINGKQSNSEFRQSMNDLATSIQQTINDVSSGYYPSNSNFKCTTDNLGNPPSFTTGTTTQGENQGCVFIGKVIQFNTADENGAKDPRSYTVYSIAGRQTVKEPGTAAPTSFVEAKPTVINYDTVTSKETIHWGTEVTKVFENNQSNPVGAIGFFGSFANYSATSLNAGAQTLTVLTLPPGGSDLQTEADVENALASGTPPGKTLDQHLLAQPNPSVVICLTSGGGHYGTVTIGGTNGQRQTVQINTGNSLAELGCES